MTKGERAFGMLFMGLIIIFGSMWLSSKGPDWLFILVSGFWVILWLIASGALGDKGERFKGLANIIVFMCSFTFLVGGITGIIIGAERIIQAILFSTLGLIGFIFLHYYNRNNKPD